MLLTYLFHAYDVMDPREGISELQGVTVTVKIQIRPTTVHS